MTYDLTCAYDLVPVFSWEKAGSFSVCPRRADSLAEKTKLKKKFNALFVQVGHGTNTHERPECIEYRRRHR